MSRQDDTRTHINPEPLNPQLEPEDGGGKRRRGGGKGDDGGDDNDTNDRRRRRKRDGIHYDPDDTLYNTAIVMLPNIYNTPYPT